MQDIDQFSEQKMTAAGYQDFLNSLPEQLKTKYVNAVKVTRHLNDVLQGYKGPARLRIPGSTYSETEEEYFGVQKVGFWYGASKQVNWVPVVGTVLFGIARTVQSARGALDWKYMYFNAATGEMLDENAAKAIESKNRGAEESYTKGEKLLQSENYEEAYNEFKNAFDNCTLGYKEQSKFKEAMNQSLKKKATQMYKEADHLGQDKKFEEALTVLKKADKLSNDPKEHQESQDKQASMLKNIGDQLRNNGSLEHAMKKYSEAHDMMIQLH